MTVEGPIAGEHALLYVAPGVVDGDTRWVALVEARLGREVDGGPAWGTGVGSLRELPDAIRTAVSVFDDPGEAVVRDDFGAVLEADLPPGAHA